MTLFRKKFKDIQNFVARRPITAGDKSLAPGDTVPESVFSPRRLRQLYDARTIVDSEEWAIHTGQNKE